MRKQLHEGAGLTKSEHVSIILTNPKAEAKNPKSVITLGAMVCKKGNTTKA